MLTLLQCTVMIVIDWGLQLKCSGMYFYYLLIVGLCDDFCLYFLSLKWGIFSSLQNRICWLKLVLLLELIHLLNLHRIFGSPHDDSVFVKHMFANTVEIISCRVFQSQYKPGETFLIMVIDINNSSTVFYFFWCWQIRCSTERVVCNNSYRK